MFVAQLQQHQKRWRYLLWKRMKPQTDNSFVIPPKKVFDGMFGGLSLKTFRALVGYMWSLISYKSTIYTLDWPQTTWRLESM